MNVRLTSSQLFALELLRVCLPHFDGPKLPFHNRWHQAEIRVEEGVIRLGIGIEGFAPRIFARCTNLKQHDEVWHEGLCFITMDGEGGRWQQFRCVVDGGNGTRTPMILTTPIDA